MSAGAGIPKGSPSIAGLALAGLAGMVILVATWPSSWLSLGVVLVAVGAAALVIARTRTDLTSLRPALECSGAASPTALLITAAALGTVATAVAVDNHLERGISNRAIAGIWLLSIAFFLLAAWLQSIVATVRRVPLRDVRQWRPRGLTVAAWLGIAAIALLPRLVWLDRFPTVLDGDEGSFMVRARLAQHGELADVFGPGFLGNPNLYPAVEGWLASIVGAPPADYRILSALVGTLGVIATWRLGRYIVGPEAAAAGAIILATMPLNLHFSRSALNNIADATTLAAALLFLIRGVVFRSRGDAALAGVALGLGFYGYFGGRVFPVVVLLSLAIMTLTRRVRVREAARLGAWMTGGFLVTAMPLLTFYRSNPAEFGGRMNQVSLLSREGLEAGSAAAIQLFVENLRDAMLYPLVSNNSGFFRRDPPYLGWSVGILLVIGLAVWLATWARRSDPTAIAVLLVPWLVLTAGVALTVPIQGQRLVALTPLFALAGGSGLVAVASWLQAMVRPPDARIGRLALAVALAVIGVSELRWFASEDRQIANYSDYRMTMMWDIGWRVDHAAPTSGEPPAVLFAGPPFVFTGGFNNLVIQAPELEMSDVPEPIGPETNLALPEGTMLVIVAEREGERCAAEALLPRSRVAEARARDGSLLYLALYREPLEGWSTAQTPAGSTFELVTASPCGDPTDFDPVSR
ncbi:MAG TPA: glycosyltransferase family 39 protein [Thermomicrobiales bacterium]|nr:glycosyltransferase family 39 protein [Thermomicrobiales bacterium]